MCLNSGVIIRGLIIKVKQCKDVGKLMRKRALARGVGRMLN